MRTAIAIVALSLLAACTSRTDLGPCVGITDDRDPKLVYHVSVWNAFLAIVFFETAVVPIVIVANQISCPVATK